MIRHYDRQMPVKVQHRAERKEGKYDITDRTARMYENSPVILYDCVTGKFSYPEKISECFGVAFDEKPLWDILIENGLCAEGTANQIRSK
ncbi:MAG: hypothetical protein IJD26_04150 [Lachnospiraceae bacterium]|nr:hypothetical protein [Lachnospiraceae bacterium]